MAEFLPGKSFGLPTTTVEISIRCSNLSDCDYLTKSDPVAVIFGKHKGYDEWVELWRSEMLHDDLHPEFSKTFVHEYRFEEHQPIKVKIYDWDTSDDDVSKKLSDQDMIGKVETSMASLVSAPNKSWTSVLKSKHKKGAGICTIITEEVTSNKEIVTFEFGAKKLDKKDLIGKSDPFMVISRALPMVSGEMTFTEVYRTNVVENTSKPIWDKFTISVKELCNGDYDKPIKFEVFDWDDNSSCDLIGLFTTTLNQLKSAVIDETEFPAINPKKKEKKSSYKDSGKVFVQSLSVSIQPSFMDYLQGGTLMNFSVAVDFTASNGNPMDPDSLHFLSSHGMNQYTHAIQSVGQIIEPYDTDKQFPALGFGAVVPPLGVTSFEFYMNFSQTPFCFGVQGILEAYRTALSMVQLSGPTNFTPVINHALRFAQAYQNGQQYFVLLILTDGIITDFEDTKEAIVNASELPISIIIIGVGDEDFSAMEELDCDKGRLSSGDMVAVRDIVQFVEMRRFQMSNGMWDQEGLARAVLAEVPKQVVKWMTMRGLKPLNS